VAIKEIDQCSMITTSLLLVDANSEVPALDRQESVEEEIQLSSFL
jgi:hypothetical protein